MKLFKCDVSWRVMDMSGGDNVDGPRWTGGYITRLGEFYVAADSAELAEAALLETFYEHQKPEVRNSVLESKELLVVTLSQKGRR